MVRPQPADSVLFVGDIQGCAKPLERLLRAARFRPDKHLLLPVGDTINRGPQNVRVLELLKSMGAEPILGNHEMRLLEATKLPKLPTWLRKQTVSRDLLRHRKRDDYLDWIRGWPLWIWGSEWVAVHGGLHPKRSIENTEAWYLTTVRVCNAQGRRPPRWDGLNNTIPPQYKPWYHWYRGRELVLYGHWARAGLNVRQRTVGLDSGCVYGGSLSGMWFPSRHLVQVSGQS